MDEYVEPIAGRVPIFATQRGNHLLFGAEKTRGVAASFIVDPLRPHLVAVAAPSFVIWLNRKGLTAGLTEPWTEAERHVTIRPYQAAEVLWLVIDIDVDTFPAVQIAATHERVAAFLSMAEDLLALSHDDVFEALVPRPARGGDRETEWMPSWLRRDGGAL